MHEMSKLHGWPSTRPIISPTLKSTVRSRRSMPIINVIGPIPLLMHRHRLDASRLSSLTLNAHPAHCFVLKISPSLFIFLSRTGCAHDAPRLFLARPASCEGTDVAHCSERHTLYPPVVPGPGSGSCLQMAGLKPPLVPFRRVCQGTGYAARARTQRYHGSMLILDPGYPRIGTCPPWVNDNTSRRVRRVSFQQIDYPFR